MSGTEAIRRWAILAAMFTITARMRWLMKPGLSLITVTGTPPAASRPCMLSRTPDPVTGDSIRVRLLPASGSGSTATVRAGSRFFSAQHWLTSLPQGCSTAIVSPPAGESAICAPPAFNSSASCRDALPPAPSSHTLVLLTCGAGASSGSIFRLSS